MHLFCTRIGRCIVIKLFYFLLPACLFLGFLSSCGDSMNKAGGGLINNPNSADGQKDGKRPRIEFDEREFNFGTVTSGDVVKHTYTFKNTGEGQLVIQNATASCGCTVPKFSRNPVLPGGKGEIMVEFNSENRSGEQSKTITVLANTTPSNIELTLTGTVLHPNEGPMAQ